MPGNGLTPGMRGVVRMSPSLIGIPKMLSGAPMIAEPRRTLKSSMSVAPPVQSFGTSDGSNTPVPFSRRISASRSSSAPVSPRPSMNCGAHTTGGPPAVAENNTSPHVTPFATAEPVFGNVLSGSTYAASSEKYTPDEGYGIAVVTNSVASASRLSPGFAGVVVGGAGSTRPTPL